MHFSMANATHKAYGAASRSTKGVLKICPMLINEKSFGFVFFTNTDVGLDILVPLEAYLLTGEGEVDNKL